MFFEEPVRDQKAAEGEEHVDAEYADGPENVKSFGIGFGMRQDDKQDTDAPEDVKRREIFMFHRCGWTSGGIV